MTIALDAVTQAIYRNLSTAQGRAQAVIDSVASGGAVLVDVYDALGALMGQGAMAAPWATQSEGIITLGALSDFVVLTSGTPTADWSLRVRAETGVRYLEGSFGLTGSGQDFTWSLATWAAGQHGQIGAVTFDTAGSPVALPITLQVSPAAITLVGQHITLTAAGVAGDQLVELSNLAYRGSWKAPNAVVGGKHLQRGGFGLSYRPSTDTFFLTALSDTDAASRYVAEISHATPVDISGLASEAAKFAAMNRAIFVQAPIDPTEGQALAQLHGDLTSGYHCYGTMPYGSKLYTGWVSFYDNGPYIPGSHFTRDLDFSTTGSVGGVYKLGTFSNPNNSNGGQRLSGGGMALVPAAWRDAIGGPAITGVSGISIVGTASDGPTVVSFDPENLTGAGGVSNPKAANLLCAYGTTQYAALFGLPDDSQTNPYWNFTSQQRGLAFIRDSVLVFCVHGVGPYEYVVGVGPHAEPYVYNVHCFRASDLAAVKAGTKQFNELIPYLIFQLSLPLNYYPNQAWQVSAWYDEASDTLFISQMGQEQSSGEFLPVIHEFDIVVS